MPPTAPRYDAPEIQQSAIPTVRVNDNFTPADFGGGQQTDGVSQALRSLGGNAIDLVQKEKQKADDTATKAALNSTVKLSNSLMYDPQVGAVNKQGKDAFNIVDDYTAQYDKGTDDIYNNLKTQDQKDAYALMRAQYRNSLENDLQKHTHSEAIKFEDQTFQSLLSTNQDDAVLHYNDPGRISEAVDVQRKAIESHAAGQGWDDATKEKVMNDAVSKTHAGVVDQYLALGQDKMAKQYYESNKDEIGGEYRTVLDKKLEEGTIKGEAQRTVDKMATNPGMKDASGMLDINKALEQTKKIDDIKLRDETERRLEHANAVQQAALNEKRTSAYQAISQTADTTNDLNVIHADPNWSSLSIPEKNAVDSYVMDKVSGKNTQTDRTVYHDLNQMVTDNRQKFLNTDLSSPIYKYKLSEGDFKKFDDMQREAKQGDPTKLDGFESDADVVNSTMLQAGLDPKNKSTAKIQQYQKVKESIDQAAEAQAKATGKKLSNDDLRRIAKQQTVQWVMSNGFLGLGGSKKFQGELGPDDHPTDMVVPDSDAKAITDALQKRGIEPTKDLINSWYVKGLRRGR